MLLELLRPDVSLVPAARPTARNARRLRRSVTARAESLAAVLAADPGLDTDDPAGAIPAGLPSAERYARCLERAWRIVIRTLRPDERAILARAARA